MADSLTALRLRQKAVQADIKRVQDQLDALMAEVNELDIAERVLLRLDPLAREEKDGGSGRTPGGAPAKPTGIPTMPEMIVDALLSTGAPQGLLPKEILEFIAFKFWPEVRPELVSPIAWRMAKEGRLIKDGPLYRLPRKNEAADADPGRGSSTASIVNPAQGREAGPGGGT